jgi:hypothetical protein
MVTLKKVVVDDLYETIHAYVEDKKVIVEDYEAMVNLIIRMIKDGHCFTMDRDILRDAMESMTYMYAPSDDMNKDRLIQQFVDEDDDDDDSDGSEEGGEFDNMDMLKMMQMMSGQPPQSVSNESELVVKKEDKSTNICPITDECCQVGCSDNECAKEGDTVEELIPAENVD